MMLKKNVKFMIDNGNAKCKIDYELAGKVLDNFLIIAECIAICQKSDKLYM